MHKVITFPLWTLDASFDRVHRAYARAELTHDQWDAWKALWAYGAPRFSDLISFRRVSELHQVLDELDALYLSLDERGL